MHWKIERDEFYSELYERYGEDFILEAGFIYDNAPKHYPINYEIECTPISFMLDKIEAAKNPAIILTTGAFCPIHDGHLEMVFKAKEAIEQQGYEVVGGYFAPDNDEYVLRKSNVLNIHERIKLINDEIEKIDWLAVDPWSGVFRVYAENFTDIYVHLQKYIKCHLGKDIPIFFVCGGDNAKFCMTFKHKGYCVVVDRPGSNAMKYKEFFNERILYTFNDNPNSSTEVRKSFINNIKPRKRLLLRVDEQDEREGAILRELSKHFEELQVNLLVKQKEVFDKLTVPLISLDSLLPSKVSLHISRQYDYFGVKNLGFTNRPGYESIETQLKKIPAGAYFIFDDDMHTGRTNEYVRRILPSNVNILGSIALTNSNDSEEVLDIRDFYFDKPNCGLVIKDRTGQKVRRPYIYPFVCPWQRGSIHDALDFSKAIWKINMDYFSKKNDIHNLIECSKYLEFLESIA